ncbi:hypothetical protein [Microbacterium jiangjiandongii]|uniref:hypothetical protein n=1 Tax=Microbacterium jiangjiandongii TaxID=3049071 RepID=UPI00214C8A10|nr:hypothetical protein [Microbacterium sp. zg.Y843]MCR2815434.1 hypothetical protein [Microbacterium sp. zg.Y843]
MPESQPWIAQAEKARAVERESGRLAPEEVAPSADAREAEDVLYRDWRRYSRFGWGTLALMLWMGAAAAASLIPAGLAEGQDGGVGMAVTGAVLTAGFGAVSGWLLWRLHRSGRAVTRALAYWVRLPWLRGEPRGRHPLYDGTTRAYTDPAVALRWSAAGVTGLLGAGGAALAVRGAMAAASASAAELGLAAFGLVLAGGMLPTAVGLFTGIRRAVYPYSDPRQALEAKLGYGPPGPVPSRHAPRSTRIDADR